MTARYRLLLVDQGLYAASNLAAVVLAGRVVAPAGFGRFMLAFLGLSVVVNGARAAWSEPEMARRWASSAPSRATALPVITASALVAGAGVTGRAPGTAVVAAAGVAAVLQDRLRYRALLRAEAAAALRSDAVWVAAMVVVAAVLAGPGIGSLRTLDVTAVLGLWTLGAAASALVNLPPAAGGPGRRPAAADPVPSGEQGSAPPVGVGRGLFLADFALQSGATQAAGLLLGLVMASGPYGELRAAITLLGPIGVANMALTTQILAGHPARARLVVAIGGSALAVVAAMAAVPGHWGTAALGSAWPGPAVLLLIGATVAAQTVSTWGLTRLKVAARGRSLLVLRTGGAVALTGATMAAAVVTGRAGPVAAAYLAVNAGLALAATVLAGRLGAADAATADTTTAGPPALARTA